MKCSLFIILLLSSLFIYAQDTNSTSTPPINQEVASEKDTAAGNADKNFGKIFDGASISFSLGMNNYFGDLADYSFFPRPNQMKQYLTPGFKISIARDIKWGLGAQLNYQKGSLIGTRKTGKNSSVKSFENHFYDVSFLIRYDIGSVLFKKKKETRLKLYANIGIGYMWYRTQLYDTATLNTKDFEGYIESDNTQGLSQKTLSDKTPAATIFSIPYGIIATYKINHKIDVHFDLTQSSTFTDRLDAFNRSWTANDKYNYIGLGVTYNFNRTLEDAPKKREKKTKEHKTKKENNASSSNNKSGLFGRKKRAAKEGDDLLNIRLKLFETQLKLFEMQYLLGQ